MSSRLRLARRTACRTPSASSASRALVGSSARTSSGSWTVAALMLARWSMPPDHWCGRSRSRVAAAPMPSALIRCSMTSGATEAP